MCGSKWFTLKCKECDLQHCNKLESSQPFEILHSQKEVYVVKAKCSLWVANITWRRCFMASMRTYHFRAAFISATKVKHLLATALNMCVCLSHYPNFAVFVFFFYLKCCCSVVWLSYWGHYTRQAHRLFCVSFACNTCVVGEKYSCTLPTKCRRFLLKQLFVMAHI